MEHAGAHETGYGVHHQRPQQHELIDGYRTAEDEYPIGNDAS
jgi:hypothetical protein